MSYTVRHIIDLGYGVNIENLREIMFNANVPDEAKISYDDNEGSIVLSWDS